VLVIVVIAVTVGIAVVRSAATPVEAVTLDVSEETAVAAAPVYAHVSGAVRAPGLYVLETGARVVDAVSAAGGFTADAARDGVNLARPLSDGEQIVVPREGEAGATAPGAPADGRVNINTADAAALETLPRIGPALAGRIIAWREENGRFTSVDDLRAVPGIGDKLLEGLRDLVVV